MVEQSRTANDDGAAALSAGRHHRVGEHDRRLLKVYEVIRSAHLERIRNDISTSMLYVARRYDFDEHLAEGVDLKRTGVFGTFWYALRHDIDIIEINEPLVATAAARSLGAVSGNRVRAALRRSTRARVVTYAIENKDPREAVPDLPVKARWRWRLQSLMLGRVWCSIDRIAYGTEGAQNLYRDWFTRQRRKPNSRLVLALPASVTPDVARREPVVTFLGDLSARKGFPKLLSAWPRIAAVHATARLRIIGKGIGEREALALAERDARVEVFIDPPRPQIHELLSTTKVLTLPSQPTPRWREQVGLPIVEALGAGCEIVTTHQTGLASWLTASGHEVVADDADSEAIADAVLNALRSVRTPADITEALPQVDGRRAAEDWLILGSIDSRAGT